MARGASPAAGEPLCARIDGANREFSEGKADLGPRSFFFLRGPVHMERRTGKIRRTFSRMHGALDGWMLAIARRLHQLKASTTMDLGISIFHFLYDVWPEKLGIVGQNWLERNLSGLLPRTLVLFSER